MAAARRALTCHVLLDRIEPSEQAHHGAEPVECLRRAAALLGAEHTKWSTLRR